MKLLVAVVAIFAILSLANAGQILSKGQDLKSYLEGAKDGTFVVLFYDREAPQLRTEDMRNQIRTKILRNHPAFNYFEVDIQEAEYNVIVDDMMEIDREEVRHSPTILIASEGRGYLPSSSSFPESCRLTSLRAKMAFGASSNSRPP